MHVIMTHANGENQECFSTANLRWMIFPHDLRDECIRPTKINSRKLIYYIHRKKLNETDVFFADI